MPLCRDGLRYLLCIEKGKIVFVYNQTARGVQRTLQHGIDTTEQHFASNSIAKAFAITVYSILEVGSRLPYYLGHNLGPRAMLIKLKY
jgi:hypothetical protein